MKWNSVYCTVWYCTVTKQNYTHGQKSWDTFAFLGRFPIHTGPTSPLTPPTILDTCIQNFFRVSTLYGVKGGGNARKFRKGRTVSWGNPEWQKNMNIASLSQGLLSMIVQVWFQDNCFFEWFLQCALSAVLFLTKMGGRLHMSSFSTASLCFLHLLQYLKKKKVNKIHINLLLCNFYLPNFTHPPQ